MTLKAESNVTISNYNSQLELWEPMLEPWKTEMEYKIVSGIQQIDIFNQPININISKSFVEAVLLTLSSINDEGNENILQM